MEFNIPFSQFLNEAPLPDDWDHGVFSNNIPFARRIRYAKERAKQVGVGSSRVAFVIPYEGRNTVLKVAKNKKGIAQNVEEINLLYDYYLRDLNLVIPVIDTDEKNGDSPTWIHMEYAAKIKDSDFKRLTGMTLDELISFAEQYSGRVSSRYSTNNIPEEKAEELMEDNELVSSLVEFVGNYTNIPTGDLRRLANWGMYKGRPVIVDMGLTDDSLKYYHG